jgi:dsDNA-specific endonuclease/ATPase MutS2
VKNWPVGFLSRLRQLFARPAPLDDEDDASLPGPDEIPVTDEIDLHGLPPQMVREVVEAYLEEARRLGFRYVRIVHGKGTGQQRRHVRTILERTPFVEAYTDAPPDRGGWGATVARLHLAD